MSKLYSFDVFDTCLLRNYAFPTDLFITLAAEFKETLEPLYGKDYQLIFRDARVDAETRSRAATKTEEITLKDIWENLATMLPGLDVGYGMEKELNAERNALRANPSVRERVMNARRQHGRVIFISDTYLPQAFISDILAKQGFLEEGDGCYVSSTIGLLKCTGSLFRHVLKSEAISPSELNHFGDNRISDFVVPKRLGVKAEQFTDVQLSDTEKGILKHADVDDIEFATRLVGEMRIARLSGLGTVQEGTRHFVGAFLGPFLFVFASWVLAKAQQDGVKRLYFLSRDGYALWHVACRLAHLFGGIECRYLQVSRQALLFPTTTEISPQGMPWIRRYPEHILGQVLAKIELTVESAGQAFIEWAGHEGAQYKIKSEDDWAHFWVLLNQEPLRSRILALAATRRDAALQYFKEQGLFDLEQVTVVDLGWLLNCHAALRDLLRSEVPVSDVRGYYFGLRDNRLWLNETGAAQAMFYAGPSDRNSILGWAEVFKRVEILEHVLACAPHGTVHHYEQNSGNEKIYVSCGNTVDAQAQIFKELVELSEHFCENLTDASGFIPTNSQIIIEQLLDKPLSKPDSRWVEVVGHIITSSDQNNITAVDLSSSFSWAEVIASLLPHRVRVKIGIKKHNLRHWPELSHFSSGTGLSTAVKFRDVITKHIKRIKPKS